MSDLSAFLERHRIDKDAFAKAGLTWAELLEIRDDYTRRSEGFLPIAYYFRDVLQQLAAVHSLKVRIKEPDHLLEKIVRKRIGDPKRKITLGNYRSEVTDLIGVRALHLFKEDWLQIHAAVRELWRLKEKPVANIRRGDAEELFRHTGCKIKEHPAGYRSVHYVVRYQPARVPDYVEIQVRTVFEEAWSEIDHRIRYPHNIGNPVLSEFLAIFNGLAGSADNMGSYIKFLAAEFDALVEAKRAHEADEAALRKEIDTLRKEIAATKISPPVKEKIAGKLETLVESRKAPSRMVDVALERAATLSAPAASLTSLVNAMKLDQRFSTATLMQDLVAQAKIDLEKSGFHRALEQAKLSAASTTFQSALDRAKIDLVGSSVQKAIDEATQAARLSGVRDVEAALGRLKKKR